MLRTFKVFDLSKLMTKHVWKESEDICAYVKASFLERKRLSYFTNNS